MIDTETEQERENNNTIFINETTNSTTWEGEETNSTTPVYPVQPDYKPKQREDPYSYNDVDEMRVNVSTISVSIQDMPAYYDSNYGQYFPAKQKISVSR